MAPTIVPTELIFLFLSHGYSDFTHDDFVKSCTKAGSKHHLVWYMNRGYIQNSSTPKMYSLTQVTLNKVLKGINNVYTNELHLSDVYITIRVPRKLRDDFGEAAKSHGLNKSDYLRFLMIQGIDKTAERFYTNNTNSVSVTKHSKIWS